MAPPFKGVGGGGELTGRTYGPYNGPKYSKTRARNVARSLQPSRYALPTDLKIGFGPSMHAGLRLQFGVAHEACKLTSVKTFSVVIRGPWLHADKGLHCMTVLYMLFCVLFSLGPRHL